MPVNGLDSFSKGALRPDRGDTGCDFKFCMDRDEPGGDRTNGLSISLEADTAVSRLPLSESWMDLAHLPGPGDCSDEVADVAVGVGGREIV